jgi:hypothetical protein
MPNPRKPQHMRQRRNTPSLGLVAPLDEHLPVPPTPTGLLKETRQKWETFWNSDAGRSPAIRRDVDMDAINRLFQYYDDHARARREYKRRPLVLGSTGQSVLNPLGKMMLDLEGKILALEDRIGKNPLGRLKMSLTFGQAHASLEEMNRRMNDDEPDPRNDDPRIIDVASS